jgi:branched-chain amino acid transport system permease protein
MSGERSLTPEWRSRLVKGGWLTALLVVVVLIPQSLEPIEVLNFVDIMILALAALGLALLVGFSGQVSIGHGAFMGIGAYTTAILVADHGWSWPLATLAAVVASFAAGAIVGLPALRIRGTALALATLGLAVVFPQVIRRYRDVTGGSQGKRVPTRFEAPDWTDMANDQWLYYVTAALLGFSLLLVRNLVRSRVGRGLVAIRDNEVAAETMGVRVAAYKVLVFGLSALFAGLAGSVSVFRTRFVAAGDYDIVLSIELLVIAFVGGIATIAGPVVGALAFHEVRDLIQDRSTELAAVVFGIVLILLVLAMPDGLVGGAKRFWAQVRFRWTSMRGAGETDPAGGGPLGPPDDVTTDGEPSGLSSGPP